MELNKLIRFPTFEEILDLKEKAEMFKVFGYSYMYREIQLFNVRGIYKINVIIYLEDTTKFVLYENNTMLGEFDFTEEEYKRFINKAKELFKNFLQDIIKELD